MGNNNGRFSDGFLMGVLIGGAAVFLLGTEKGNKVLKVMLKEGKAGISDLMEEIDTYRDQARDLMELATDDDEDIDQVVETAERESAKQTSENTENVESSNSSKNSSSKRFFKKGK